MIKYLRSDSAAYQADIINFCEKEGIKFVIGADLDKAVVEVIENIPQGDWMPYKNGCHIAEGDHSENRIKDLKIGFCMERMPCGQYEVCLKTTFKGCFRG